MEPCSLMVKRLWVEGFKGLILFVLCLFNPLSIDPSAFAQQPFYKGKTIRIVVGSTPGGFYDRWARLLARHIPKYIPGNPEMIVQNMPGNSSMVATNYVYGIAKPDGLTLVMPTSNIYIDQLVGRKEAQFDVRKFNWIGTQEKNHIVLYMRADAPYRTIGDILKAKEPPKCGAAGTTSADYVIGKVLDEAVGAKINTVLGYPGGREIDVAVEKGEVVCRGMTIPPHFGREPFESWHENGFDRHLVQTGRKRDSRLSDTPTIYELMDQHKTPEINRRVTHVMLTGGEFGRPMLVTPATPPDRVKILREAYAKALKDPELLAEAKKGKMDMEPSTGEELQRWALEVMNQPPEVIKRVKKIFGN